MKMYHFADAGKTNPIKPNLNILPQRPALSHAEGAILGRMAAKIAAIPSKIFAYLLAVKTALSEPLSTVL